MPAISEPSLAVNLAKKTGGVQSVAKAFGLLRALAEAGGPCRLSDLARATGLSPSLTRAYLINMQSNGVIRQDAQSGLYDLGIEVVHLGMAALSRLDLVAAAKPAMESLCHRVREPNSLSIWGEKGLIVAHNVELHEKLPYELTIGSTARAATTAAGHCFLAYMESGERDAVIAREHQALDDDAALPDALAEVRRTGLATRQFILVDREDAPPRPVKIIAAPIFGQGGRVRAALTVLSQNPSFDLSAQGEPARALLECTQALSFDVGFTSNKPGDTT
jgi:DNA-binding IclR family transcriptional regulator